MTERAADVQQLALLLRAELKARQLPAQALPATISACRRFRPSQATEYAVLAEAAELAGDRDLQPPADICGRVLELIHAVPQAGATTRGPVLLLWESRPFEPDLTALADQLAIRMVGALDRLEIECWILRLARRSRGSLAQLLGRLPASPALVATIDLAHPELLQQLSVVGPTIAVAARCDSISRVPCVEHDWEAEAMEIASYAARLAAEQIAFVGQTHKVANKRRISSGDTRLLRDLSVHAQDRFVITSERLVFWADSTASLQQILPEVSEQTIGSTLLIVCGCQNARQAADVLAPREKITVLCRDSSAAPDTIPTIGPDLDALAAGALGRLLMPDGFPPEAAVLVAPAWHRKP